MRGAVLQADYSLRLLAEMGVDVYLPRGTQGAAAQAPQASGADPASRPVPEFAVPDGDHVTAAAGEQTAAASLAVELSAEIILLHARGAAARVLADVERSVRMMGWTVLIADAPELAAGAQVRALVVLGESLARELGAALPAQRQRAIEWIVAADPAVLARSAAAKRALWGEFKRVARVLADPARQ